MNAAVDIMGKDTKIDGSNQLAAIMRVKRFVNLDPQFVDDLYRGIR